MTSHYEVSALSDNGPSSAKGSSDHWTSEADLRRQVFEGQLNKFTNVVKGWQYRWFVVRPETGHLEYHLMEDTNLGSSVLLGKEPQLRIGKCRGSQHLAGSIVVPSDEDSLTFNAIFASGETYKLRAANVKERQVWVDRLRAVAHLHDKAIAQSHPPVNPKDICQSTPPPGSKSQLTTKGEPSEALQHLSISVLDAFGSVHDILHQVDSKHRALCRVIEKLPMLPKDDVASCHDHDLLMIKAASQSAIICMENALAILQEVMEQKQEKKAKGKEKDQSPSSQPLSPKKGSALPHNVVASGEEDKELCNAVSSKSSGPTNSTSSSGSQGNLSRPTISAQSRNFEANEHGVDSLDACSTDDGFQETKGFENPVS